MSLRDVELGKPAVEEQLPEAASETEVHDRRLVAAGDERGREVLEPERLDAEKRSQSEPFVARVGAQKENVQGACLIAGRPRL